MHSIHIMIVLREVALLRNMWKLFSEQRRTEIRPENCEIGFSVFLLIYLIHWTCCLGPCTSEYVRDLINWPQLRFVNLKSALKNTWLSVFCHWLR
jgi:hypothetical protein